ncbi:calcium/calmodulin-dependent protein kinase kinase 2 [Pyricularia oryzae]|uniref:Calcium/calmodulin-dependent protein kinase kinase 2 n=2 Tax=Pyricularia oryzae TaxID=318829 RepID=A0AA97PA37_PYRO3|nr:calcium/calmodulin-dependent protein kinase kinase 2 [Pyricularia oryzae Y34]KAI7917176.1 calcium/calmodulin-dependent protein kinase kinase 2 [Pyricularia oryzae]
METPLTPPPQPSRSSCSSPALVPSPSPGIQIDLATGEVTRKVPCDPRPAFPANLSAPAVPTTYQSPIRQHRRTPSQHREVKETLNARSEYTNDDEDGRSHQTVNQYTIKEEIGRGSYGAVHLATDQYGNEYAVKEFSKARLRKRAQSNILKGPREPGQFPRMFQSAIGSRLNEYRTAEAKDALYLIREEIAIMKKLNHPNLVQLIEVLDDPEEDSLWMVLEMCKKGVIMKVGLDQAAEPYGEEQCRHWFRDLILGIEYLHAQGIVHRDIKPDNLLLTEDDILKVVDFGVSEMFEKPNEMQTAKSAGSPAFLPPELCVARHGNVSGAAADIWSMGASLYCMRYGRIPFDRSTPLEIYEAITTEPLKLPADENPDFVDLLSRIMQKDPGQRIRMEELREHPWVTRKGTDFLLSKEDNCSVILEPPNGLEVNHAFTRRMSHLLCVMKAISRFKSLLYSRSMPGTPRRALETRNRDAESHAAEGKPKLSLSPSANDLASTTEASPNLEQAAALVAERHKFFHAGRALAGTAKGQAHDPTDVEPLFLGIGTGGRDDFAGNDPPAEEVSESPVAVDFNVYDSAYKSEVDRIKEETSERPPTMFLTQLVDKRELFRSDSDIVSTAESSLDSNVQGQGSGNLGSSSEEKFSDLTIEDAK